MNFEEFLNNRNGRGDTFEEGIKRAGVIKASLKDKFGLDIVVLRGDSPIKGTVGYVLVKIEGEGKTEKIVPIDIQIDSPVKEKIDLLNIENLEKKYDELVKDDYPIWPYISLKEIGIVVSYNSKRVLYYIKAKIKKEDK